jgi:hypothetical protein
MARYDRIAPLTSPAREQAFPAWPVLRDIEGQDRDADVCRRARLRFLALRPVRRIANREAGAISAASYGREIERVREELGGLPARDVERIRVTRFLRQIEDRDPRRLVHALLDFAEQSFAAGHIHAANEFAQTADTIEAGTATAVLERFAASDPASDGDPAVALESAWNALRQTEDVERRAVILERIGRALLGMRMLTAAERCLGMITQRQTDLSIRSRARAAHAVCAGLNGDAAAVRERRNSLLNDDAEWAPDPRVAASVHIDLAYACVLIGDLDDAREHVRNGIGLARRHNYAGMLTRAESILTALEQNTEVLLQPRQASTEAAQRIAAQIELLELPTPAH